MKIPLRNQIFSLSTTFLLSATSLIAVPTPSSANPAPRIRDSQILPYLLDNPNDNSVVRVRCFSQERQQVDHNRRIIRDSLLQPNSSDRHETVTIEIEGSCRNVRIRLQDDAKFSDFPVHNPYLNHNQPESNDSWLTRQGSGWYWLLQHP